MFKRKSIDNGFDFRTTAERCAMGDVDAMYQMSKWFRGRLTSELLDLEKALESADEEVAKQTARNALSDYLGQYEAVWFDWRASNFWMNRAALYGHAAAKRLAEEHPRRCLNAYVSPYHMLPLERSYASCLGESLNRLGLLQFDPREEYDIRGMNREGVYHAKVYRGYDGPDETGFGMEENYSDYYYDEFFNILKGDRKTALIQQQEKRCQYWKKPWNQKAGTQYSTGILNMELQLVRQNTLVFCMGIRNVIIPETVTAIEAGAFQNNAVVESVVLPDSLEKIGEYAFASCEALCDIRFPAGLKQLDKRAFFHCHALKEVTLPDGLREIEEDAFLGCHNLRRIHIPASVDRIGKGAFMYCEFLEQIEIPTKVRRIEKDTCFLCKKLSAATLPSTLEHIGEQAFYRCPCESAVVKKFPHLYQVEEKNKKFLGLF